MDIQDLATLYSAMKSLMLTRTMYKDRDFGEHKHIVDSMFQSIDFTADTLKKLDEKIRIGRDG